MRREPSVRARRNPIRGEAHERVRQTVLRNRRPIAAILIFLAVLLAAQGVRPQETNTQPVLTAAMAIQPGHVIAASDLAVVAWPADLRPASVFADPAEAIGRAAVSKIDAGEGISANRVLTPGALTSTKSGDADTDLVAMGVRLADPAEARLLRAGDVIDVLAARAGGPGDAEPQAGPAATVVASAARIIAIPDPADGGDGLLSTGGGAGLDGGAMIVLAVEPDTALQVAAAAANSRLSAIVRAA